ncbi:LAME_0H06766g1_1 [Lachancea meyersii CBS 8951]|uniref:RING-type E3 ubiquitin transferase n=1 Tax=Lachancea meyersii CBS 8951 TaxID=1266667 RepID=A0A1G4KET4_9SACH|nr:LAME_0H06766g1_1 [Lachancea meyersii CBS 8951]
MVVNVSPRTSMSSRSRRGSTINNLLNSMGIRQGSNNGTQVGSTPMDPIPAGMPLGSPTNGTGFRDQFQTGNATPLNTSQNGVLNATEGVHSNPVQVLSSDDEDDRVVYDDVDRDEAGRAGEEEDNNNIEHNHNENGGLASANMLGTTPFDQGLQNSTVANLRDELPITLTLGQNDIPPGPGHQPSTLTPGEANMVPKAVRHFVYGSSHPESAVELLSLDISRNAAPIEPVAPDVVQSRKDKNGLFSLRLTPFLDQSASTNPGLYFEPIVRTAGPCSQLVIGRYTERVRESITRIPEHFHPVVFKSKVVSRTHGCFKVDQQGNWYIRDVKSSSGTFLNHHRLAPASTMSKDTLLQDGDLLQLGLDFRGGTEEIYRSVKMRVELNKSWKRRAMRFNREALQRLKNLQKMTSGLEEEDCSICLSKIKPCQAIFISPCSHSWHYQCVRRLVVSTYPQFVCPNCRSSCDLEASLDSDLDSDENEFDVISDEVKDMDMQQDSD